MPHDAVGMSELCRVINEIRGSVSGVCFAVIVFLEHSWALSLSLEHSSLRTFHSCAPSLLYQATIPLWAGYTLLHWAAMNGDAPVIRLFLANPRVDVNVEGDVSYVDSFCSMDESSVLDAIYLNSFGL